MVRTALPSALAAGSRRKIVDAVMAGVKRWQSSKRWRDGFITNPSTFLDQERWKDTPPAGEPKKGELRPRETTAEQSAEATAPVAAFEEFKRLAKLPENPRRTTRFGNW